MTGPWIIAWVALALLALVDAVLVLGLLQRLTLLLQSVEDQLLSGDRLGGVPVGGPLPSFQVKDPMGRVVPSSDLIGGPGIMLLVSQNCAPCERLLQEMTDLGHSPTDIPLVVTAQHQDGADPGAPTFRGVFRDDTAFDRMNIAATPIAMSYDSRGIVIARTVPNSIKSLRELEIGLSREGVSA